MTITTIIATTNAALERKKRKSVIRDKENYYFSGDY